jgi:hypothetical protein
LKLHRNINGNDFTVSVVNEVLFRDINVPVSCDITSDVMDTFLLILSKWDLTGGGACLFEIATKVRLYIDCDINWNLRLPYSVSQP